MTKQTILQVMTCVVALVCGTTLRAACLPAEVERLGYRLLPPAPAGGKTQPAKPNPTTPLSVYIDRSKSMAGYAKGATDAVRPLGDLIALLEQSPSGPSATAHVFGRKIETVKGGLAGLAPYMKEAPYLCAGCDVSESRIDTVIREKVIADAKRLHVIVTDLWLDNKAMSATANIALGTPLKQIIADGRAVGVIGVKAPFNGRIYDVPGAGHPWWSRDRAWFVLLIGPDADVRRTIDRLTSSGSSSFADGRMEYSLFSDTFPTLRVPVPNMSGGGIRRTLESRALRQRGVAEFKFDPDVASRKRGQLARDYVMTQNRRAEQVWTGAMRHTTDVWRLADGDTLADCKGASWTKFPALRQAWVNKPIKPAEPPTATFYFDARSSAGLPRGGTYLVAAKIGSGVVTNDNPASEWMREWSLSASDARAFAKSNPAFFKALNLREIARLMEDATAAAAPRGHWSSAFAFVVHIED